MGESSECKMVIAREPSIELKQSSNDPVVKMSSSRACAMEGIANVEYNEDVWNRGT